MRWGVRWSAGICAATCWSSAGGLWRRGGGSWPDGERARHDPGGGRLTQRPPGAYRGQFAPRGSCRFLQVRDEAA